MKSNNLDCSGIYSILNSVNGKRYIGATFNFKKRFKRHKSYLLRNNHPNRHLQYAWNKYGEEKFDFKPILLCKKSKLDYYEIKFIKLYKTMNSKYGYNLEQGGGVGKVISMQSRRKNSESKMGNKNWIFGKHHSEETKRKISESLTGKHLSKETKRKIGKAIGGAKHYCFGKHLSKETRRKISEANIGKRPRLGMHHSEESKRKMSLAHVGRKVSEESKRKMSKSQTGRKHSEETKRKISESNKRRKFIQG